MRLKKKLSNMEYVGYFWLAILLLFGFVSWKNRSKNNYE